MSTKKAPAKEEKAKAEKTNDKVKKAKDVDEDEAEAAPKKAAKADTEEKKPSKKDEPKAEKAEAKPAKAAKASTSAKVYQQASSYEVDETIFHPVWKVEGKVTEVGKTTDGKAKITVDFGDFGVKRLIAELQDSK